MITVRCPICDRVLEAQNTAAWPHYPFCGDRCRLIDLGRWLGERYRIAPASQEEGPADSDNDSTIP